MLFLVCMMVGFLTASLTLAEGTRTHSESFVFTWHYLIPYTFWLLSTLLIQRKIKHSLPNRDPWIFPFTAALIGIGLLFIWRISPNLGFKQALWYLIGSLLFIIMLGVPDLIKNLKNYKYAWLFFGLILIGLTFIVGVNPTGTGQKLWLKVFDFYIQPSEPLKLLLIIYLAAFYADQLRPNISWISSIFPTLVVVAFAGLLLIAQRDLGTATIFISLYILMLSVTTQRRRLLWVIPALAVVAGAIGYFAFDVVKTRVDIWLNPWLEPSGSAWQLAQAQIAIATGGITGTGPGLGSPQFVPIAVSDFIFTTIGEELGLFGTGAVLISLLFIILRGINIALANKTTFGRYLAFGISAYFGFQTILIVSGNLGLFPLTGITLPFLSYGGSSLVTNLIAIMLLLKLSTQTSAHELPDSVSSPYKWVAGITALIFVLILGWNGYLAFPHQEELIAKAENPRWAVYDRYSPRGDILALSGEKLAENIGESGSYQRRVTVPELSNTIGYALAGYGQSGIESSQYTILRGYVGLSWQDRWLHERLYNQPPPGLDIKTNLNLALQEQVDELLGEQAGAVVIMNADTGEIYAMASHPYFDANELSQTWESLMSRTDAPLLNRATMGSYPIGTLITTVSLESVWTTDSVTQLSSDSDLIRLDSYCYQAMKNDGQVFSGLQYGCESTSEELLNFVDPTLLINNLSEFGLFSSPDLAIQTGQPAVAPTVEALNQDPLQVMDLKVSPLQMALVAATITNDGVRPAPRLVNAYQTPAGNWQAMGEEKPDTVVMSASIARRLRSELVSSTHFLWYQIGHALINNDQPLTWYIGGTLSEWTGTPLAIAIAIEGNAPELAQSIGGLLLTFSSAN